MISITPSHIIEYLYCNRFTYFEYVLGIAQYEERHYKVQKGRDLHKQKETINADYLRKKLGVKEKYIDQYLANELIRGKVDEVLLMDDDTMAPLDYKFAEYKDRIYSTYLTQLLCYAWLIESNFNKKVNKGFLVYCRSKNKLITVDLPVKKIDEVKHCAEKILWIIENNYYPKATTSKRRCITCTYRNICVK
jgi:CRISPR-associated exonuclease Cas4